MDLSQSLIRELLDYDPETGLLTWRTRPRSMFATELAARAWIPRFTGKIAGVRSGSGYLILGIFGRRYMAHRICWVHAVGEIGLLQIDHINGTRDDNRLCNLRAVTAVENCRNKKTMSNNKSGVNGVCWMGGRKRWVAQIGSNGTQRVVGSFHTFEEAVAARMAAEKAIGFHPNHGRQS